MTAPARPPADPRSDVPGEGDERTLLVAFLRWQRETLELKCAGLGAADLARRSVEPSAMSLLGLVRHMAEVERAWFRRTIAAGDPPRIFRTEAAPDADWAGADGDDATVAAAWDAWRAEVAFAERVVAEAPSLDVSGLDRWGNRVSLRWVLLHMIEEYARHNGHADLLRERIDGAVGQ